ncbi:MAG: deoxyguanosinetriphosphate triphosphohydrolase [Flavobacteriaceae bacterium TMED184]|nr:MAG: deoxyguanosinetriphosphate triphosphohydrolase [Flavobacteriaceae bacterium TMED184]
MNWLNLFSAKRFGVSESVPLAQTRSRFEQDYDRIIFSHPFRKLQDKTQVFPMPEDDFVHSRLTHSLEVAIVGRSLAKEVGKIILSKNVDLRVSGIKYQDFGDVVSAACLAHDLGNPPFGHSGEQSISSFFLNTEEGQFFESMVKPAEWSDLINFEGNAQGFRILTNPNSGGLSLTYSTLATFTKYPLSSTSKKVHTRQSQHKFGFFNNDFTYFKTIAEELQLTKIAETNWLRHPLAFLVEAADDICYSIIDLEDATRLGLISFDQTKTLLAEIIGPKFSEEKLSKIVDLNEKLGVLRALAIYQLIQEVVSIFISKEAKILTGEFDHALTDKIPSTPVLEKISSISVKYIYQSGQVLEREIAGYEIIEKLTATFCQAVFTIKNNSKFASTKDKKVFRVLPDAFKLQLKNDQLSVYENLRIVIDFISGLTDSNASRLFKIISGNVKN